MSKRIYLDHNATTPIAPEVAAAMQPYLADAYGNPSSLHWAGLPARDAVERARSQVAALLACDATEIVFTSGGTEANNYAIKGLFFNEKNVEQGKAVLVDVREKSEWERGHIEKCVLLPLSDLRDGISDKKLNEKLPEKKILYTYCVVGKRAVTAGGILEKAGFEVRPLKAGYKDLLKAGFESAKE